MPRYKLSRPYYDGTVRHEVDAVLTFEEGKQPRTARLVEEPEVEVDPSVDEEVELSVPPDVTEAKAGDTLSGLAKGKK